MKAKEKPTVLPTIPTVTPVRAVSALPEKLRVVPGENVFCVDCIAYQAKDRRCHFWPPPTNSSFTVMRGPISDPKTEWCMQFKLRNT